MPLADRVATRYYQARTKTGASEIPLDALIEKDPWVKDLLGKLARFGLKRVEAVWSGIHGNIIEFGSMGHGRPRLTPDDLVKLAKLDRVRWYEFGREGNAVAIEGSWIDPNVDL